MTSSSLSSQNALVAVIGGLTFAAAPTALITRSNARLEEHFVIIGKTGKLKYPWRLANPIGWLDGHILVWLGFLLHLSVTWVLLGIAQKEHRAGRMPFANRFRWVNWALFATHTSFILLHWIQTHLFYDGLAKDVPESTALSAVALLLMFVVLLEAPRRGLFWGRRVPLKLTLTTFLRDWHGHMFSFALIYTFWYHPTVATAGHLVGFFYMFFLLWQSVLVYHPVHLNKWWKLFLEVSVIPHSVSVSYFKNVNFLLPMFLFGFLSIFIGNQMHGLGWSSRTKQQIAALYCFSTVAYYSATHDSITRGMRIPSMYLMLLGPIVYFSRKKTQPRRSTSTK